MTRQVATGFYTILFLLTVNLHAQDEGLQLYVLGNAQDAGVPQLGCEKSCCNTVSVTHYISSLAVVDKKRSSTVIFDASPDLPQQLRDLREWSDTATLWPGGIYLTHAHMGHYSGLLHFGREASSTKDLPVYTLPRMRRYLENNGPWSQLVALENINLQTLRAGETTEPLHDLTVIPLLVPHRDEYSETAAFLIQGPEKTALYVPDIDKWHLWEYTLEDLLKEVDFAFIDATFYSHAELPGRDLSEIPHPTVKESMELLIGLTVNQRSKVYFIHMNHTNPMLDESSTATQEVLKRGFNIARVGTVFNL